MVIFHIDEKLGDQMKNQLKQLAKEIRELKAQRGPVNNGFVPELSGKQYEYRHRHIAYCMLRGRSYEQIEKKCAEGNKPNMEYVNAIKTLYISRQEAA